MPEHYWNPFGVPQFNDLMAQKKWRYERQAWRDKFSIRNPYGAVDMDDPEFQEFYEKHKIPDAQMPSARRVITPDRAQHLALTFNMTLYRSTKQKRAQLEDVIYWGYVTAIERTLTQCMYKETDEAYRYCRPLFREYFDAVAPITNVQFLWTEGEIENAKARRLKMYERWNQAKQDLWDRHGYDAIERDM